MDTKKFLSLTRNDFYSYLKKKNNNVFVKFFNKEEYALDFAKGEVCLGSINYYRTLENGGSRADRYDSLVKYKVINPKRNIVHNISEGSTLFAFCCFGFKKTTSYANLERSIDELGKFACVMHYQSYKELYNGLLSSDFHKTIKTNLIEPDVPWTLAKPKYKTGIIKSVKYLENPSSYGDEKNIKYAFQEESRLLFETRHLRQYVKNLDEANLLLKFRLKKPIYCELIRIID